VVRTQRAAIVARSGLHARLGRLEAGQASTRPTLTVVLQYVSPDGAAVSERWLRYRVPGEPPDESSDGGRTWRSSSGVAAWRSPRSFR
jgi:hypothetical protein